MRYDSIIKQLTKRTQTQEEQERKKLALKNAHPMVRDAFSSQDLQSAVMIMDTVQANSDAARDKIIEIIVSSSSSLDAISLLAKQIQNSIKHEFNTNNIQEYSMCFMNETKDKLLLIISSSLIENRLFSERAKGYIETLESYQTAFMLAELIDKMDILIEALSIDRKIVH